MYKKEEAENKILDAINIIGDIYYENIPIDNFSKTDLFELQITLTELLNGVMYSKEIES